MEVSQDRRQVIPTGRPHVAVLMAVHAGADPTHLDEALSSMRTQTYRALRLFVYADGPLDAAHEAVLARHLDTRAGRDSLLRGKTSMGLPTGLNALIDAALQDPSIAYLARMDADDISVPERIAQQVAHLEAHPEVSVLGTWCIEFTTPGVPHFHKRLPTNPAEVPGFMLYRSPLAHPTVMFRRNVFEAGHRYSPAMMVMQDYELWARLIKAGWLISNVPEYLLWYRMAEGFYGRRTGLKRAWREVRLRWDYARASGQMKPAHIFGFLGLFAVRVSPVAVKRLAYKYLR